MSQQEVIEFLRKQPNKWFYAKEISESIPLSYSSITGSLKRLRKNDEVLFKETEWKGRLYQYKFKE